MSVLTAALFVLTCMRLQQVVQLQQYQVPKDREGFFNKTAYVRIIPPFNFHRQIGLNFRTCAGGQLFTQTYPHSNDQISLEVTADSLKLAIFYGNKLYDAELKGHFLDNNWHTVNVIAKVNNITLSSGSISQVLANSTYNVELLNSDIPLVTSNKNSKLIVGQGFVGCLLDGPSIIFNSSSNQAYNVEWGPCPYNANVCAQVDYCSSEPCMMHGTCISHTDHYQCICGTRYSGSVCEIDNGSPCKKGNNPCINNGRCEEDRIGNYECICEPGYTGVHCETELTSRLCETNPCQNNGFCHVLPGGNQYECVCVPGFIGKNCETNINECVSSPCLNSGVCIDGVNNYTCNCTNTGYKGINCEININECEEKSCFNHGKCFDTYGSFICECEPGFEGTLCENDIDECASLPCRHNGFCKNSIGSYECHCRPGYSGRNCQTKLNECENTICPPDSICIDDAGIHRCVCATGFTGVPPNCTKITTCSNFPCSNNGVCSLSPSGDINCTCPPGFTDLMSNNKSIPLPLKLYAKFLAFCLFNKTTNYNAFLNAASRCNKKFIKNRATVNVNIMESNMVSGFANTSYAYCQCESNLGHDCRCNYNLSPINVASLFGNHSTRTCNIRSFRLWNAFIRNSKLCQINVDECFSNPCQNGGTCIDGINGFKCNCTNEYTGPLCQLPLDGCVTSPCRNNGSCVVKNRKEYQCDCPTGFDGVHCENNIDDCLPGACPPGKICVDGINSHECRCKDGYAGDDCSVKLDIPRCRSNSCINGFCVDTPTGYVCNCSPGYEGLSCEKDIDECKLNYCKNGYCVNSEGSYQCFCTPGFTGDHCEIDFDECLSHPCSNGASCINGINKFQCVCTAGYTGKDCSVDINECDPNPCYNDGVCLDGIASYLCECPIGWTGSVCNINIDDCRSSPCLNNGVCVDGINNYTCDCTNTGFVGRHCETNIDDCVARPCVNNASCVDLVNDYRCNCYAGYSGKNCEIDIDECESNPCQNGGTCLERSKRNLYNHQDNNNLLPALYTRNSFSYAIAAGYECLCGNGLTGTNCEVNVNECESNPCRQNGKCVDEIGGYTCECEDGFEGKHCEVDVDECERYQPCVHGSCIDRRAGYYCDCSGTKYGGKNCSVELIGCNRESTCLNNGTCKPYLIGETEHRFNCTCTYGFHGAVCEKITTMSLSGESHIMVNTTRDEGYDISFRFKTTLPSGLLAIGKGLTFYILELVNGRLNLHSSLLNKWEGVFIGSQLNDSNWQKVFVAINSSHVVLAANEEQTIYPINLNEGANASHTSFPTTYVGGATSYLRQLTHGPSVFVGCTENIVINGQWVIPQETNAVLSSLIPAVEMHGVQVGCPRRDQCHPNPCHNGGECTDLWKNFSCACQRPYLGFTCQYNLTAATFGHENITDSLVTVSVSAQAKRAVRNIVDISMFIRTRQLKGAIFYLGSIPGTLSYNEETHVAAELEAGELLVRIQFNGTEESYTVGGVKLNDGLYHLIQVVRNVTLIQVKINGTEYFRKTIGANGPLDAQVLYLGGFPSVNTHNNNNNNNSTNTLSSTVVSPIVMSQRAGRQAQSRPSFNRYPRQTAERFENIPHFKGVIQDVQISNGISKMVVEFMPLENKGKDVLIPKSFGNVSFNPSLVLEGVISDNTCASNPCYNNVRCTVTWNDYVCECPRGYKGKQCQEMEFCQLQDCPVGSECRNLNHGYECVANITLGGATENFLQYSLRRLAEQQEPLNSVDITYRSKTGGPLLYVTNDNTQTLPSATKHLYFAVFVFKDHVMVTWELDPALSEQNYRIKKDHPDGEWTSINMKIVDNKLHCSFAGVTDEPGQYFVANNFSLIAWNNFLSSSNIYIGGGDSYLQEFNILYDGDFTNSVVDTADVTPPPVDEFSNRPSPSMNYKGCIGEVRIGSLLLPYFTDNELNNSISVDRDYFTLLRSSTEGKINDLGCYLCFSTDCKNGGRCKNGIESYDCECAAGFSGEDCSHNIDECLQNKCQHGATCIDGIANYTCQCTTGWTGWLCDVDIDECASNPCRNNGTCIDHLGFYECNCTEEFVGKQCEQMKQITCDSQPCKNDAVCSDVHNVNTGDNFTCGCLDGFVGIYCDDTFCSVKPCRNKGLCVIRNKAPMCECSVGFTGKYCEDNIDDCIPSADGTPACLHKGRCIDDIASYYCNCTGTGYTGEKCDIDIDECIDGIANCGERGKCENLEGSYRCKCDKNVCGYHCDLYDPCLEMPCQNGGTCQETCTNEPDYECTCPPGFVGKNCTELPLYSPERVADIAFIVGPILAVLLIVGGVALSMFVMMARKKRATRGTYSPSSQEYCNPRVELDNVMKPPPEERLI